MFVIFVSTPPVRTCEKLSDTMKPRRVDGIGANIEHFDATQFSQHNFVPCKCDDAHLKGCNSSLKVSES